MIKSKYITILLYIRRSCFLIIMDTTIKVKSSVFNHAIMHIYIYILRYRALLFTLRFLLLCSYHRP